MKNKMSLLTITLALFLFSGAVAQESSSVHIDAKEQKQVIDSVSRLLVTNYIFPEVAQKMSDLLQENYKKELIRLLSALPHFRRN